MITAFGSNAEQHWHRARTRNDGRITGGDAFIDYEGRYRLDGKHFEAVISTKRHTEGPPTWFGIDEA